MTTINASPVRGLLRVPPALCLAGLVLSVALQENGIAWLVAAVATGHSLSGSI